MKYIIVNTKNKLNKEDLLNYYNAIDSFDFDKVKFIICPKEENLNIFEQRDYCLGVQNVSDIKVLKENNVTHAIVGHSDYRKNGETTEDIIDKVINLQINDIKPIVCIGENIKEISKKEISEQLIPIIEKCLNSELLIIAYEPVWAIGNNIDVDLKYVEDNIKFIKDSILEIDDTKVNVVYGGSVNKKNILKFNKSEYVDGFLISTGALNPSDIKKIIEFVER